MAKLTWKWKLKVAQLCPTLCDLVDCTSPWNSPCQNTGVGCLSLLQEIFPTHGLNPGLLHCRQILYQLSHKGSPRIMEWVAYPFSSGSSQLRNRIVSPTLQIDSLPTELSGKPQKGRRQKPKRWAKKAEASRYVWVCLLLLSVSSSLSGLSFPNHAYFTSASGKECCKWRWLVWHRNNDIFSKYKIGCIFLHTASQLTCSQTLQPKDRMAIAPGLHLVSYPENI